MPRLSRQILLLTAACGIAATAFVATTLAAQVTIVGRWRVLSGQSSSGGAYCTMQLGKVDTFVGIQVMADGNSFLSVGNSDWSFAPKQRVPVKIAIDGAATWDGQAVAALPNTLVLPLQPKAKPQAALGGGRSLVATIESKPVSFDLAGASEARDALETCLSPSTR